MVSPRLVRLRWLLRLCAGYRPLPFSPLLRDLVLPLRLSFLCPLGEESAASHPSKEAFWSSSISGVWNYIFQRENAET